jgi:hypothetical protein
MKSIEEKLAANQLDRLAKHWSGMKGKRIQPTDAIKLSTMVAKFGKDELEQLAAKDIPFLSMAAINNLMIKHDYNAAKIKSLMKEDTELLYDLYMFEDVDAGEYDYEGDMAKTQLVTISDAAEELHDMLEDDENMPEWCQNKITKAMDYLDSVRDYMLAKDTGEEPGDENPNESVKLEEVELDEKFEPKTAGMKITHKKPHPAGGHYVVLSKPGAGQHVIRHLNKGKVKTLGTVASLGLAKSYIDAKVKGKDPKDLIKKEDVNELNKDTLQKYHKKTQDYMKTALKKDDPKMLKKYGKRLTGSGRANDRLKKMGEATNPLQKRADANKKAIDTGFMKLSKSDYEKEKKRLSGEGAMKRIATTQSNKAERIGSGGSQGLNTFKKKPQNEKLEVADGMSAWIDDFKQSDAPQFKGKNAKERRDMAIAAYLDAKKDSE